MKFFIRRKSKIISKAAFGSALFMVSAFAMFTQKVSADTKTVDHISQEKTDTITARSIFEKIHLSALEILPRSTRLDMLDYWDVDSVHKVTNVMEGLSWLEQVTPSYLKVHISAVSTLEIKLLSAKKNPIVMTIYTVGDDVQAQDSQVKFFSIDLQELDSSKYLQMPQLKDFFDIPKGSTTKMKEIEDMIPFPTLAFSANPENDNLKARLTVEQYINQDDWNIARLFVKPYITLIWEKEKYKVEKSK
ncbi:MAG: DUF3256 family protein [Muribaculaceae bacterium]|nr:DUF3256 family protein [Muribaculaceae bacterium]